LQNLCSNQGLCWQFSIRPQSTLALIVKMDLFGIFFDKFFDHMYFNMLSKFIKKSAQKSHIFPIKASVD